MSVIFLDENLVRDLESVFDYGKSAVKPAVSTELDEVEKLLVEIRRRRKERSSHTEKSNDLEQLDLSIGATSASIPVIFPEESSILSKLAPISSKQKASSRFSKSLSSSVNGSDSDSDATPFRQSLLHPTIKRPKAPVRKPPTKKPNGEPIAMDSPSSSIRDELQKAVRNRLRGWGIRGMKGPEWARVGRKLIYQEGPDNGFATFEETLQITSPMESSRSTSSFVLMQDEQQEISSPSSSLSSSLSSSNISRVASARSIFQQSSQQTQQPLQQKQQQQQKVQQQIKAHQHELQKRVEKAQQQAQLQVRQQSTRHEHPNNTNIPVPPISNNNNTHNNNNNNNNTTGLINFPQSKPHTPPQTPRQQQPLPKPHTRGNSSAQDLSEDSNRSQRNSAHTHAQSDASHRNSAHAQFDESNRNSAYAHAQSDASQRTSARDSSALGVDSQRRTLQQLRPVPVLPRLPLKDVSKENEMMMSNNGMKMRDEEEEEEWEADESESTFLYSNASSPRAHNHRYEDTAESSDEEQVDDRNHTRTPKNNKRKVKKDTSHIQQQQQLQLLLQHQLQQQLQQQLDQLQKQQGPNRVHKYHEDEYDDIIQHRRLHGRHSSASSDEDYERQRRMHDNKYDIKYDIKLDGKNRPRRRHSNPKERTNITQEEDGKYLLQRATPDPIYSSGIRLTTNRVKKFRADIFPSDDRLKELTAIHAHEVVQDANFKQKFSHQPPRSPPSPLPPLGALPLESPPSPYFHPSPPYHQYPSSSPPRYQESPHHDRDDLSDTSNTSFSYYAPAPASTSPSHPHPYPPHYPPYLPPHSHYYPSPPYGYPPEYYQYPPQMYSSPSHSQAHHSQTKSHRRQHSAEGINNTTNNPNNNNRVPAEHQDDKKPAINVNKRELNRGPSTYVLRGLDSSSLQLEEDDGSQPAPAPVLVAPPVTKQPSPLSKPPREHVVLSLLVTGTMAHKSTRRGAPHARYFRASPDLTQLTWGETKETSKKSSLSFLEVNGISAGMPSEKAQQHFEKLHIQQLQIQQQQQQQQQSQQQQDILSPSKWAAMVLSLSLVSRPPLEIIFDTEEERQLWESGLTILWKRAIQNQIGKQEKPTTRPSTPTHLPPSSLSRASSPSPLATSSLSRPSSPHIPSTPPKDENDMSDTGSVYTDDEIMSGEESSGKKKKGRRLSSSLFGSLFKKA